MHETTSIRVSRSTRDELRELADRDGLSLDEEIRALTRAERQRRMGQELADLTFDEATTRWLEAAAETIATDARR